MARNVHSVTKVGMVVHGTWRWNHQWETEETFRQSPLKVQKLIPREKKQTKNQENSILKIYLNLILAICIASEETKDIDILCICASFGWDKVNYLHSSLVVLWFGSVLKTMLVTLGCFSCC